jgi:cytochrome c556
MKFTIHSFLLAAFIGALGAGTAAADSANDIKYREAHMKALSGHLGPIFMVLKGEAGDKSYIAAHASALADVAMMAGSLFPAGFGSSDTAALPVIWEKPGEFRQVARALANATANLKAAAGAVGKACGGCHKVFPKKKIAPVAFFPAFGKIGSGAL